MKFHVEIQEESFQSERETYLARLTEKDQEMKDFKNEVETENLKLKEEHKLKMESSLEEFMSKINDMKNDSLNFANLKEQELLTKEEEIRILTVR